MKNLNQSVRYNRKEYEYDKCIQMLDFALFSANEDSLDTDLIKQIEDLISDAKGMKQSELDKITNGF